MHIVRSLVLHVLCLPWNAAVTLLVAPLCLFQTVRTRAQDGVIWLDIQPNSFLHRAWPYSTTLGHVVLLQPEARGTRTETHELVHVRQFEGAVMSVWLAAGSYLGITQLAQRTSAWLLLLLLAPWWSYFGASAAAFVRGQRPYLDNHFERHARAETALEPAGKAPPSSTPAVVPDHPSTPLG